MILRGKMHLHFGELVVLFLLGLQLNLLILLLEYQVFYCVFVNFNGMRRVYSNLSCCRADRLVLLINLAPSHLRLVCHLRLLFLWCHLHAIHALLQHLLFRLVLGEDHAPLAIP